MYEMISRQPLAADRELEQDALADLVKLQRQYRIMENDKKAYIADTFNLIEKQEKLIKELQQEKINVDASLDMSRSNQYLSKDVDNFLRLRDLLKQKEEYIDLIKSERNTIKTLEKEQKVIQRQVDNEWRKIGGKKAIQEQNLTLAEKCRRTENILEHGVKEYNKFVAENQRLRTDIENLLIVRRQFNHLHGKLSHYLSITKREMNDSITNTTQAFGQREECQTKLQNLKERWEKDDTQYQQELRDLQRTLADDQRLKEFMEHKTQDRQILLGKKAAAKGGRKMSDVENNVEFYRKAFSKIATMTGEENVESLVERILRIEEDNFALFNYVNELNREIEQHQANVQKLRDEIVELRASGHKRELQRQDEIRNMETELENITIDMDKKEENLRIAQKGFDGLKDGIQSMFENTKASELVEEGILEDGVINDRNTMAFLSAIEQKATQLVIIHDYLMSKGDVRKTAVHATKTTSTIEPTVDYLIPTPNIAPEPEVDSDTAGVKPLKRNELKEIIDTEKRVKSAGKILGTKSKELRKKTGSRT